LAVSVRSLLDFMEGQKEAKPKPGKSEEPKPKRPERFDKSKRAFIGDVEAEPTYERWRRPFVRVETYGRAGLDVSRRYGLVMLSFCLEHRVDPETGREDPGAFHVEAIRHLHPIRALDLAYLLVRAVPNLTWGDCVAYLARKWEEARRAKWGR